MAIEISELERVRGGTRLDCMRAYAETDSPKIGGAIAARAAARKTGYEHFAVSLDPDLAEWGRDSLKGTNAAQAAYGNGTWSTNPETMLAACPESPAK
jgi:hypothetical protein